jgi:mxaL protein
MTLAAWLRRPFEKDTRTISLACALLFVAPILPPFDLSRATYDYVVVFDISQSMNVEDYELAGKPVSRLAYARESARQALRMLPCGSRVGWAAFTEYRTLMLLAPVEVCRNYDDLLASLANIGGGMRWSNASEIAKGVFWAMRAARDTESGPDILFLTDGQEAPPVDPKQPLPLFDDLKVGSLHGWLMGVGGDTPRPIPRTDEEGRAIGYWRSFEVMQLNYTSSNRSIHDGTEHLSALREPYLKELARRVGFDYARLTGVESIGNALRDPRFARRRPVPTDLSWLPILAALALLVLHFRPDGRLFMRRGVR